MFPQLLGAQLGEWFEEAIRVPKYVVPYDVDVGGLVLDLLLGQFAQLDHLGEVGHAWVGRVYV